MSDKILRGTPKVLWDKLHPQARRMRRAPTGAEARLWERLRGNRLGQRFRRQHILDRFIVDFFCFQSGLIVEIDGLIHEAQIERDGVREAHLKSLGYTIMRFTNEDVALSLDSVLERIRQRLESSDSPSPSGEGAGG